MRKVFYTLAVLAAVSAPAAAQEKEFVLDRSTGAVTAKDVEQDKEIAALKAEVARLKAQVVAPSAATPAAPVVAVADPFASSAPAHRPCESGACLTTPTTGATAAAGISTSFPDSYGTGLTYTLAPGAVTRGATSGCAGGACGVQPARFGLFRRR